MADERKIDQRDQSAFGSSRVKFPCECEAAKYVQDFDIQQVRNVKRLMAVEHAICVTHPARGPQENLDRERSIEHDHGLRQRRSRSSRTAFVGEVFSRVGGNAARRALISSSVGRSAILRTSRIR